MSNYTKEMREAAHSWELHCMSVIEDHVVWLKRQLIDDLTNSKCVGVFRHLDDITTALKRAWQDVMDGDITLPEERNTRSFHKAKLMAYLPREWYVKRGLCPPDFSYLMDYLAK